jgi:uncharacterized radical SAM superfamily protein
MKLKDTLVVKHGNVIIEEMIYLASTEKQHLFTLKENIVKTGEKATIIAGDIGAKSFIPIKKKHNFIQIDSDKWELDVEFIDINDLS